MLHIVNTITVGGSDKTLFVWLNAQIYDLCEDTGTFSSAVF